MSMDEPRIESVARIVYPVEAWQWPFLTERAGDIDAHWTKIHAVNPRLFNGRVLLMRGDHIEDEPQGRVLRGSAFEIDYKAFLAWRAFDFADQTVTNVFAMSALRSADSAFLLGRMGENTVAPGRIYFPAGTPDRGDIKDGHVDFDGSALRELTEETGFGAADVTLAEDWTLVFDRRYLACMKLMQAKESAATLIARFAAFHAHEKEPELAALVPVFSTADFDAAHMPPFMLSYLRLML